MKVTKAIKGMLKPLVDLPRWLGWKQISANTANLKDIIVRLFIPQKPTHEETFDQAIARLNLTEEQIQKRYQMFFYQLIFWVSFAVIILGYAIYLAGRHSPHGFLACIAIALVVLSQAFRAHFWIFQIKQRRLGCTFREYLNSGILGVKR